MSMRFRREFLASVGSGMMIAGLGSNLAAELGLVGELGDEAFRDEGGRLTFGDMEPLVAYIQETEPSRLQAGLVDKIRSGLDFKTIIAAGALANARVFGGQDYDGYHTFMALGPALSMSSRLATERAALPILKVLYRNAQRIQSRGGPTKEALGELHADHDFVGVGGGEMQEATRSGNLEQAEQLLASMSHLPAGEAYNHLQYSVQDEVDVHRVVLAWRAWMTLDITGPQFAQTLLRQSVRYCVDAERQLNARNQKPSPIRELLPKLLSKGRLLGEPLGDRDPGDGWLESTISSIVFGSPEQAATLIADALAEGIAPSVIGEAISLASTRLLLHDRGLTASQARPDRPEGSVHGASIGVHASDSANAWRNIARVTNQRNTVASLIVGAYHTAGRGGQIQSAPIPYADAAKGLNCKSQEHFMQELHESIQRNDQLQTCALVEAAHQAGMDAEIVLNGLLDYAVSEDGALHAEKYFRTVQEEFATTRSSFRWQHLVGLGRVTASEFGHPAPGQSEARQLLGI